MMEYKLLDRSNGVILTRQPKIIEGDLLVSFASAPDGATAVFELNGDSYYRLLSDGACTLPIESLDGVCKVSVMLLDGATRPKTWICEEFVATRQSGGTLIAPNDMNLPQKVVDLLIELCEIRASFAELQDRYEELKERFDDMLEGYDIT